MKALVMTVAALATAFGTAYGLKLLFPHPEQQRVSEDERPALERILQQPLAAAPIPSGRTIDPADADAEDDGGDRDVTAGTEAPLSEDMNEDAGAPSPTPIETAAALQVDPPAAEARELGADAPPAAEPDPAPKPEPTPESVPATPAADSDRPARATAAPPVPASPTPTPAPKAETDRSTAPPRAPRPTVPEVSLDAWWGDGGSNGLNVLFAGSAAYEPAVVLILSGTFADGDTANRAITVSDVNGNPVDGRWAVSRENNRMLVFPVAGGGIYRLAIDGSLGDSQGRTLGRTLGGPVHVR